MKTLKDLGFTKDEMQFVIDDEFACKYKGWNIGLAKPNGGIIAVSIQDGITAYSLLTELDDDLPDYDDTDGHVSLAKEAIDLIKSEVQ